MESLPTQQYTLAWFTLAECIANNQKERALGLYNLLSHSFEDHAFSQQLKADLLCAFDYENAMQVYEQAAQLYRQSGRLASVVAIYEHIILQFLPQTDVFEKLAQAYQELGDKSRTLFMLKQLVEKAIKIGRTNEIAHMLSQIRTLLDDEIYEQFNVLLAPHIKQKIT